MRKVKCLISLLICLLFVPRVYAFSYELGVNGIDTSVDKGTELEIELSLKNIQGTDKGIDSCSLNISFDNNILLNSRIRGLGSFEVKTGDNYSLTSSSEVLEDSSLMAIPIKVNGNGFVKIEDITCYVGSDSVNIADRIINFTVNSDSLVNPWDDIADEDNNYLSGIRLSEGAVTFSPEVTEYTVSIADFDKLIVDPILVSVNASYYMEKINEVNRKQIIISVVSSSGKERIYKLNIDLVETPSDDSANDKNSNNMYIPIFISILLILLVINVVRIIKNRKK